MLKDMAQSGVRILALTGGEPLLRKDLPVLVKEAKKRGMVVGINTNGTLIPQRFDELKDADYFQLSLDGPKKLNDFLRGQGSYKATMEALQIFKSAKKTVKLNATITKGLNEGLQEILSLARKFDVPIMFHPVGAIHAGSIDISSLQMNDLELAAFFDRLMQAKKDGYTILNSESGLRTLQEITKQHPLRCYAGRLMVGLTPEGKVISCNQLRIEGASADATGGRFLEAVKSLPAPACNKCLCANLTEMNLLIHFDLGAIKNALLSKF